MAKLAIVANKFVELAVVAKEFVEVEFVIVPFITCKLVAFAFVVLIEFAPKVCRVALVKVVEATVEDPVTTKFTLLVVLALVVEAFEVRKLEFVPYKVAMVASDAVS